MIDIESKVFNDVATELRSKYPGISVYGEYIDTPSSFPCVTIVEDNNSTYIRSQDEKGEHHANVMYAVNVYSNLVSGKKSQAKSIAEDIDSLMLGMNFTRNMMGQIPNVDRTIYRVTARYTAVVREGITDGDDVIYEVYRK